ncbi:MAG: type II toxin-antitoxin system VapC family toxin [Acidobacteriota bacterium]
MRARLLLDTHVFLWWRGEPARIKAEVRDAIATADVVFVSVASAWEAAIKASLGRLELPDTLESGVLASGFEKLPIAFSHCQLVAELPQHHGDPFDRMLVAQATAEKLTLVTHDPRLEPYDVKILWS